MQKINGISMKKTYFKTVLLEFLAVCMAVFIYFLIRSVHRYVVYER